MALAGVAQAGAQGVTCQHFAEQWTALFQDDDHGLFMLQAPAEETAAQNRGLNSNLVIALTKNNTWLIGSTGLPSTGAALACSIQKRFKRNVTDLVQIRPHPEAVMGSTGLLSLDHGFNPNLQYPTRVWALPEVREAMRKQCPICIERFNARIQGARESLTLNDVALANNEVKTLTNLGPFKALALPRQEGSMTLILHHEVSNIWILGGLLWAGDVPDARDTHPSAMIASLTNVMKSANEAARFVPEQGGLSHTTELSSQLAYWQWLDRTIKENLERGATMPMSADDHPYPSYSQAKHYHLRHALNLQRVWRLLE